MVDGDVGGGFVLPGDFVSDPIMVMDKLKCAGRELKLRQAAYPRWVNVGKMTPGHAARELAVMQAIVDDYMQLAARERLL